MTQIDNKFEPTNRANRMTLSVNKYVTCTHNAQIRQVSIWKVLPGGDNARMQQHGSKYFALRPPPPPDPRDRSTDQN